MRSNYVPDPLCPDLYSRLERVFGDVKIANEREAGKVSLRPKLLAVAGERDWELDVSRSGEYYRVCCPFCGDSRHRLWINHQWAEFPQLAICFNINKDTGRGCLEYPANRAQLRHHVLGSQAPFQMVVNPGTVIDETLSESAMPGEVTPVTQLPLTHEAISYLSGSRGFVPQYLWDWFRVGYCQSVYDYVTHMLLVGRIFIPVYQHALMVGCQGRLCYDPPKKGPPKYFTKPHFPRRLCLYNYDSAIRGRTVIFQEGPTDVWATGPEAVCSLGMTMSPPQRMLLALGWARRGGSLVICLDAGATLKADIVQEMRNEFEGRVAVVTYPDGGDPGGFKPRFNRRLIYEQATAQGVPLPDFHPEAMDDVPTHY